MSHENKCPKCDGTGLIYPVCPRCNQPVGGSPHRVRVTLVNAASYAARGQVEKEADMHHACAAAVFHAFNGDGLPPAETR